MAVKALKFLLCLVVALVAGAVCSFAAGTVAAELFEYLWPIEPDASVGDGVVRGFMLMPCVLVGFAGSGLIVMRVLLRRFLGWSPKAPAPSPVRMWYPDN